MELIKRPKNFNYQEIQVPIGTANGATFPEACPCCGAERTEATKGFLARAEYACGGKYESIPQIQNHTDKYMGACGEEELYNEQERVAKLIVLYNMFCNWTLFPKALKEKIKEPTVKDHVVHRLEWSYNGNGSILSAPKDFVDSFVKWVDENFDKYKPVIDKCLGKDANGRYLDPRFICGFDEEWNPVYVTDPTECMIRLSEVGYNEYGKVQFHKSFTPGGFVPAEIYLNFIGKEKIKTV